MKDQINTRRIKICRKTVSRSDYSERLPSINLTGVWLRNCGFQIGDTVEIIYGTNKLVIRLLKNKSQK